MGIVRRTDWTEQAAQQVLVYEQDNQEAQHKGFDVTDKSMNEYELDLFEFYVKLRTTCNLTPSAVM